MRCIVNIISYLLMEILHLKQTTTLFSLIKIIALNPSTTKENIKTKNYKQIIPTHLALIVVSFAVKIVCRDSIFETVL